MNDHFIHIGTLFSVLIFVISFFETIKGNGMPYLNKTLIEAETRIHNLQGGDIITNSSEKESMENM